VSADDEPPPAESGPDPGDFCIKQRADWLAYAMTYTRSLPDAEDAVSHVVQKILEHRARHGTLCPDTRDAGGGPKRLSVTCGCRLFIHAGHRPYRHSQRTWPAEFRTTLLSKFNKPSLPSGQCVFR
jgi:hypothetical protein